MKLRETRESFVPALAGCGVVARGFGFMIGASEGCGGGVARCKSSFRTYVPAKGFSIRDLNYQYYSKSLTFSHEQLVFGPRRVT